MRKRLVQALIATAVAIGAAIGAAGAAGAIDLHGGPAPSRGAVTDGASWD
jgi:hypothetical protein